MKSHLFKSLFTVFQNNSARKISSILYLMFVCQTGFSQISISSDGYQYTQNFNSLSASDAAWTNDITLPDWHAASFEDGNFNGYLSSNASGNEGIYSYGNDGMDRALGSITTNDSGDIVYGALFQNNSGVVIHSITLTFRAEHWRRSTTDNVGHQRVKVSYTITDFVSVVPSALLNNNLYTEIPEAYLISIDTTSSSAALNGNLNAANISVTFPVFINPGWQLFLRFYDENASNVDIGLAVDDLHVTFSNATVPRIVATSDYTVFSYLDMGITQDIPEQSPFGYFPPEPEDITEWQLILDSFFAGDLNAIDGSNYGYIVTEFTDKLGRSFNVLRMENTSPVFWGTYVTAQSPTNTVLVIQSPHPFDDDNSGRQGAAIFHHTGASVFMIAGIGRCSSPDFSPCQGTSKACSASDQPFRISDMAHIDNSIFQLATTILATQDPSLVFVQLHGFSQDPGDPQFIISCGTLNGHNKSVPDYAVLVRENLLTADPSLEIKINHVDDYEMFGARDNVQGRYLNLYPGDPCTGVSDPLTVTNRFLHIEQYPAFRDFPNHYPELATALSLAINQTPYERAIPIQDVSDTYVQNFNALFDSQSTPTWGNNLHLPGWYAVREVDGLFSTYSIGTGSSNSGGLYALGELNSNDRALGALSTTSSMGDIAYGVLLRNETGATIFGLQLNYRAEQWRATTQGQQRVKLGYLIDDEIGLHPDGILTTAFTDVPAGDLITTDNELSTTALNGNVNAVSINNLSVPIELDPGQEIFLRFLDENDSGFDKVMAIDDLSISFSQIPLLVDWVFFTVTKNNGRPLLQWEANKEDECKTYVVLRSEDGKHFDPIQSIPCKGNKLTNRYEFIDYSTLWRGNVYYKIAQYDFNGDVTYSSVKSFNSTTASRPEVYYKNGRFNIETSKDSKLHSIAVLDFMGRQFCNDFSPKENTSDHILECPAAANQLVIVQLIFESGTYIVHMKTGN